MPRKPNETPIACQYFTWRLLRRDGVYYADGRGTKHNLGKHSLGTRDRDQAVALLRVLDHQKAVEKGLTEPKPIASSGSMSIGEGWKMFLDHSGRSSVMGGVSPATLKRYKAVRDKHANFCASSNITDWKDFDAAAMERYGNWLSKRFAYRTQYFELTLLKSVNGWLVAKKLLQSESKLAYALRKPQGTDTYCYSAAEVAAMVRHCENDPRLHWMAHVIIALAHTGLRIGELAGLRWSDVNLTQNTIRVADERASQRRTEAGTARTTKGRRSRVIPLHAVLKRTLLKVPRQVDGLVVHAVLGGKLLPRNVLQAFIDEVIEPLKVRFLAPAGETGFEHGRLHSFRHFFCSQAFLGGASEGEIREWLGHADSKMVEHYRHLRNDDAQRKMDQIDFLGQQAAPSGHVA
jgi:integrase